MQARARALVCRPRAVDQGLGVHQRAVEVEHEQLLAWPQRVDDLQGGRTGAVSESGAGSRAEGTHVELESLGLLLDLALVARVL